MKDYYKTLGVEKTSSDEDIKLAYRKLAKQYHPDINPNDKSIEAKFKEINEAYDILRDKSKRKEYDMGGRQPNMGGQYRPYRRNDFSDVFADIFGNGEFDQFFGGRARQHYNENYSIEVGVTLEEVLDGVIKILTLKLPNGVTTEVQITIPKGVSNGHKIILKGKGANNNPQIAAGDLIVICRLLKHDKFERHGVHLIHETEVNILDLLTGTEQEITTLDGTKISLKIPKGTEHGKTFRVPEKGLCVYNGTKRGDLHVVVKSKMANLSEDDINLIKQIKVKYS